ncbi:hypothetical protein LCM20_09575 [Halobacillus litoralis]|uniref:hypothetical protein n=1 Tax=Halobacillus litoralis TaxID=45668 RepID=UPI001CD5A924|nr:hypothetical protein [Halobacillus litoralis]MCA0970839.1 hypothetical protein [Halobacillus litoralis]
MGLFFYMTIVVGLSLMYYAYVKKLDNDVKKQELQLEEKKIELEMKKLDKDRNDSL